MSDLTLGWTQSALKLADPIETPTGGKFTPRKTCAICDKPIGPNRQNAGLPYCSDPCYHERIKSVAARHRCAQHAPRK